MRIAYLYSALNTVGGADRVIINKANYFAEQCGYEVFIITAHQCGDPVFFPLSDKIKHIDLAVDFNAQYKHSFFVRGAIYFYLLRQYKRKLSRLLCELKLDIVITTISRDVDFLHSIRDGSIKIAEAHVSKDFVRNYHLLRQGNILYKLVGHIWTKKLERAVKKFNAFVVLTQADAANWSKVREAVVIHNSISFVPESISNLSGKQIIAVGRLSEQKGFDRLIKSWSIIHSRYPGWSIQLYGEGELKKALTKQIQEEQISDSFHINAPVKNIADKYAESAFCVMSSRFEGWGLVIAEAMACGLPVIAFDCPTGPSDIISDGKDGFLVENGNIKVFAEKMAYLIEHQEARVQMGNNAISGIQRYSVDSIMKQWLDLFELLKRESNEG